MKKVRIIRNWDNPDLFRQTPKSLGFWEDIQFTEGEETNPDYVVVSNYSEKKIELFANRENIWVILQEPPNEYFKYFHKANDVYQRVFTQDISLKGERYVNSQPALPWHINKSYDDLVKQKIPQKLDKLSFITTSKKKFSGHKLRIEFLETVRRKIEFDLFGYGFKSISDKWDALAPYKYSLVVENYSGPYYWSEKLADCFLSFTMPIYYGCSNITEYFPKESLIQIDIKDKNVTDIIDETLSSNLWEKSKDAIAYSRQLILSKYQFFPFIAGEIHEFEKKKGKPDKKEEIIIPAENTLWQRSLINIKYRLNSIFLK